MGSPAKIFLVEDEALSAFYMTFQLGKIGYQVIATFATGEEAVIRAEEEAPDLLLMDINLAGEMSGIEAARRIKSRSDVPVIFITGYSDAETREEAAELRPVAFLVKPVDFKELSKWMSLALQEGLPA